MLPPILHKRSGSSSRPGRARSCTDPVAVRLIDGSRLAREAASVALVAISCLSACTTSGRRLSNEEGNCDGNVKGVSAPKRSLRASRVGLLPSRRLSAFSCCAIWCSSREFARASSEAQNPTASIPGASCSLFHIAVLPDSRLLHAISASILSR